MPMTRGAGGGRRDVRAEASQWGPEPARQVLPAKAAIHAFKEPISAEQPLPAQHDYYRFSGSLTTPPCRKEALAGDEGAGPCQPQAQISASRR